MEEKKKRSYKVEVGDTIRVLKSEYKGYTFYNVALKQREFDGTTSTYYRPIMFKKGVSVPNGAEIIIKEMIENLRKNRKDSYNPITTLFIRDFVLVADKEREQNEAFLEYQKTLDENEKKQREEILEEITEDDLPF